MELHTQPKISEIAGAAAVHIFTASGAALGLLALLAASESRWAASFAWLGAALIVDTADGPIARRLEVKRVLPRFSGENLDNLVDYLTYVTVPAFMVARGPLVPEALRLPLAAVMMVASLYHFADKRSKSPDNYFVGFPAIWNAVILYCFVLAIPPALAAAGIAACVLLTFVPISIRPSHPRQAAPAADFGRHCSLERRRCRSRSPRFSSRRHRTGHIRRHRHLRLGAEPHRPRRKSWHQSVIPPLRKTARRHHKTYRPLAFGPDFVHKPL